MPRPKYRASSLPDEEHRAVARTRASAPARAQPRPAAPHAEARTVPPARGVNGAGKVHHVVALAVLDPDRDAHVGRSRIELAGALGTAVARLLSEIRTSVVGTNPVRRGGHGVAVVERHQGRVVPAVFGELQPSEPTRAHVAQAWIDEHEKRKLGVVRREAFRNLRNGREVGLKGVNLELAAEAEVPELLGLSNPRVVGILSDAAAFEARDEFLHFPADAGLAGLEAGLLNFVEFGDVPDVEENRHENLRRSILLIRANPYFGPSNVRMHGTPCRLP